MRVERAGERRERQTHHHTTITRPPPQPSNNPHHKTPRRRYSCIGTSVDDIFYMISGLKIGGTVVRAKPPQATANVEAHVYASLIDLYDVVARMWLRSRVVLSGGCIVTACSAARHFYVLASHAMELLFREQSGFGPSNGLYRQLVAIEWEEFVRFERRACVGVRSHWWRVERRTRSA